jgi:hypothetical protein
MRNSIEERCLRTLVYFQTPNNGLYSSTLGILCIFKAQGPLPLVIYM